MQVLALLLRITVAASQKLCSLGIDRKIENCLTTSTSMFYCDEKIVCDEINYFNFIVK